ncbi:hypothetical protein [Nonomuraea sp. NEAU-A123]|uniref:hypothetical protein n=1 Tax=Nonomuraea sp. NEAU-A123 TaxID=2839649 RepID=UPI001BE45F68|nr:hypothetical protein [Nonomuraea sp. NEAU-A123]MBT2234648.1 hypothetical protein [Nonomuraea sp. NEAU-A123]
MRVRLLPVVPLLALALAACGQRGAADDGIASAGKGTATPTASSSVSEADRQAAQLKFTQCMREHGVNMPDPGADGKMLLRQKKGDDPSKMKKATEACQPLLKDVIGDKVNQPMDPKQRDQMVKFARCMREHGVDMPDPGAQGEIRIKVGKGGEKKLKEAQEACKSLAPGFGPGFRAKP